MALLNDVYKEVVFVEAVATALIPVSGTGLQASVLAPTNNLLKDVTTSADNALNGLLPAIDVEPVLLPVVATVNSVLLSVVAANPLAGLGDIASPLDFSDILGSGNNNLINIVDNLVVSEVLPVVAPVLAAVDNVLTGINAADITNPVGALDIADILDTGTLLTSLLDVNSTLAGIEDVLALVPTQLSVGLPALQGDLVAQVLDTVNPLVSSLLTPVINELT